MNIKNLKYSLASQSDVYVRKVGMFDGLLSDECHKLTISKNKLLYIGTYNGLSIYNGVTIKANYEMACQMVLFLMSLKIQKVTFGFHLMKKD